MFAIIGIVVVFGAVLGGYLMEHGSVKVLLQPAELLIIGGAAGGTVLIANPLHILKNIVSAALHYHQRLGVHPRTLLVVAEARLPTAEQGATAGADGARIRY